MTTRDPGASDVFTHGFVASPRSTALLATRPAATRTCGLEVLVQLVIAAITTSPSVTGLPDPPAPSPPSCSPPATLPRRGTPPSARRKAFPAPASDTRSCGREGPARLGTIVARSRSTVSVYCGSTDGSCQRPCSFEYTSTSARCS